MADKIIPVKVALRIRPLVEKEINEGCQVALESVDGEPQVFIQNSEKSFTYDYVFGDNVSQEDVYVKAVKSLISKLFSGYNVTVLAYGQTGSGKTHSMGTAYTVADDPETEGVIPRSVSDIFTYISTQTDKDITVRVSFLELYKEQLFDLFSEEKRREDKMVEIREDTNGIKIPGLTNLPVTSVQETFILLEKASGNRVTASTAMNSQSSRSHALFTLNISISPKADPKNVSSAQFHLVDLAGSERVDKTKATGVRLKEGININMGLLGLGNVISALGDPNQGPNHHVPYRDSKLTRLLQDSLGGNSHTLMIACCSPADSNLDETLSTLRYADRARKIKNKPIVNKDPKAAELSRLRSQVQELKMQLLEGGGSGVVTGGAGVSNAVLEEENRRLVQENGALTTGLQASLNENGHINEKLMLSEQNNDKLKLKLEELNAQAEQAVDSLNKTGDIGQITIMKKLKEHVVEVQNYQKQAEKTMVDHDISRFNQTPAPTPDTSVDQAQDGDEEDLGDATHALRQTELANQLNDINKVLARKQELAGGMGDNHEKLLALKKQYETALKGMEDEITKLQKEKDSLSVQQRKAGVGAAAVTGGGGANNKVSEMRRKRIQELESQILDLRKKQKEQQKLAKINEQNELKVKKLNEEIKQMKVAKVKLIKQMKEDSEKVRQWKMTKEKEVHQLKQKDRKQQVTISKMERLHERQQTVMKRKMEESSAINKRLKDALAKKEAVQKQREGSTKRLEGAGDRVRGWIKSEIELVVSTKEAETTKEQLISDRKSLASKIGKLRADMRKTMNQEELEESNKKLDELQTELDYRNAQISELQKQLLISSQETDKIAEADRWTKLNSMVEAKIAAQYLFETASDYMAQVTARSSETKELQAQLDELRESWDALKKEVRDGNMKHEDQIVRLEREHEEKVLYLLRQLNPVVSAASNPVEEGTSPDVTPSKDITLVEQRLKFQAAELEKYSDLHDELIAKDTEVAKLKTELEVANSTGKLSRGSLMPSLAPSPQKKKTSNKRVTIAAASYKDADEFFKETFSDEESEEEDDDEDSDDEWRQTPMFKRLKQERAAVKESRQSLAASKPGGAKKRRKDTLSSGSEDNDSDDSDKGSPKKKLSLAICKCKTGCKTKKCACKKAGPWCSEACKCDASKCAHREVPGPDVSTNSNNATNKENMSVSEGDNTANLLNGTFDVPTTRKPGVDSPDIFISSPSKLNFDSPDLFATTPKATMSPLKPMFKKPIQGSPKRSASGSETDTTPTNKKSPAGAPKSFFSSPQLK